MTFEQMWAELAPIGRSAGSGGYFRQPFASAERECFAWFVEQASTRDLRIERDGFGNAIAWWEPDGVPHENALLTGSHLDSVLDGGAFDGPLGVVSAFAALDRLRADGFTPARRIGIGVFAEEEGSRFGLACLGSRLAVGAMDAADAQQLTDSAGVDLGSVWDAQSLDPTQDSSLLDGVGTFLELHVEQGRDLIHREQPIALASEIWPHGRYRFDFCGAANHAGSTRMEDRHDPMLTYAMTALAANKQARLAEQRATFGRLEVAPNGTNAIASRVSAWLDARAGDDAELAALVEVVSEQAASRAASDGTTLTVTPESVSSAVRFTPELNAQLAAVHDWPIIASQAGHDAGVLAAAGIETAMLFVRNPSGVSHAPEEHADMDDCLAGVDALADVVRQLG